jgi:hypothetical protein
MRHLARAIPYCIALAIAFPAMAPRPAEAATPAIFSWLFSLIFTTTKTTAPVIIKGAGGSGVAKTAAIAAGGTGTAALTIQQSQQMNRTTMLGTLGTELARVAISSGAQSLFARQASQYSAASARVIVAPVVIPAPVAAAASVTGATTVASNAQLAFQYAGDAVTFYNIVEFLSKLLGPSAVKAEELDKNLIQELAVASIENNKEFFLKICANGSSYYPVPSSASHCFNGSEPQMLEKPLDLTQIAKLSQ